MKTKTISSLKAVLELVIILSALDTVNCNVTSDYKENSWTNVSLKVTEATVGSLFFTESPKVNIVESVNSYVNVFMNKTSDIANVDKNQSLLFTKRPEENKANSNEKLLIIEDPILNKTDKVNIDKNINVTENSEITKIERIKSDEDLHIIGNRTANDTQSFAQSENVKKHEGLRRDEISKVSKIKSVKTNTSLFNFTTELPKNIKIESSFEESISSNTQRAKYEEKYPITNIEKGKGAEDLNIFGNTRANETQSFVQDKKVTERTNPNKTTSVEKDEILRVADSSGMKKIENVKKNMSLFKYTTELPQNIKLESSKESISSKIQSAKHDEKYLITNIERRKSDEDLNIIGNTKVNGNQSFVQDKNVTERKNPNKTNSMKDESLRLAESSGMKKIENVKKNISLFNFTTELPQNIKLESSFEESISNKTKSAKHDEKYPIIKIESRKSDEDLDIVGNTMANKTHSHVQDKNVTERSNPDKIDSVKKDEILHFAESSEMKKLEYVKENMSLLNFTTELPQNMKLESSEESISSETQSAKHDEKYLIKKIQKRKSDKDLNIIGNIKVNETQRFVQDKNVTERTNPNKTDSVKDESLRFSESSGMKKIESVNKNVSLLNITTEPQNIKLESSFEESILNKTQVTKHFEKHLVTIETKYINSTERYENYTVSDSLKGNKNESKKINENILLTESPKINEIHKVSQDENNFITESTMYKIHDVARDENFLISNNTTLIGFHGVKINKTLTTTESSDTNERENVNKTKSLIASKNLSAHILKKGRPFKISLNSKRNKINIVNKDKNFVVPKISKSNESQNKKTYEKNRVNENLNSIKKDSMKKFDKNIFVESAETNEIQRVRHNEVVVTDNIKAKKNNVKYLTSKVLNGKRLEANKKDKEDSSTENLGLKKIESIERNDNHLNAKSVNREKIINVSEKTKMKKADSVIRDENLVPKIKKQKKVQSMKEYENYPATERSKSNKNENDKKVEKIFPNDKSKAHEIHTLKQDGHKHVTESTISKSTNRGKLVTVSDNINVLKRGKNSFNQKNEQFKKTKKVKANGNHLFTDDAKVKSVTKSEKHRVSGNNKVKKEGVRTKFEAYSKEIRQMKAWNELDRRPLPEWYDRAKIGIFIHWGLYSVPGFGNEWFWLRLQSGNPTVTQFMKSNYPPNFTYKNFAPMFKAELFDPEDWAELFLKSGAKYVVLTSKHHDGYSLYPASKSRNWNSKDVGPRRDLVGDLSRSVKAAGLKFGLYHSLLEWYNPIYQADKRNNFSSRDYPNMKLIPELKQIVNDYEPSIIWSDGDWEAPQSYWNPTELLEWFYNNSTVKDEIVVNDRWGKGTLCRHGDSYTCKDRFNPGKLFKHKWENCFPLDKHSWGFRRNLKESDFLTFDSLLYQVVSTVSCGGNVLINIGPNKDGIIIPLFQDRLLSLGDWLSVNGEAIYNTSPWLHQQDSVAKSSGIWYTCVKTNYDGLRPTAVPTKKDNVTAIYAIFLNKPKHKLKLKNLVNLLKSGEYKVELVGREGTKLKWEIRGGVVEIMLPDMGNDTLLNSLKITKEDF